MVSRGVSWRVARVSGTTASGARRLRMGQRLEDGSPQGQNQAQPGFGTREPSPGGGKPKRYGVMIPIRDIEAIFAP